MPWVLGAIKAISELEVRYHADIVVAIILHCGTWDALQLGLAIIETVK